MLFNTHSPDKCEQNGRSMASFVLPHHASAEILHEMLRNFRQRLDKECIEQCASERAAPPLSFQRDLLGSMQDIVKGAQKDSNTQQHIIYWPMSKDPYRTKRCIINDKNEDGAAVSPSTGIHLVPILSLLTKLHPSKKNRFLSCQCTNHSKRVRLNWREFIYPQFIDLLFKRVQLPSTCPSPSTKDACCILNEELRFCMEIDKEASFISRVANDLFRLPSRDLHVLHKNRHLARFGRENVEQMRHFKERHVTENNYKIRFKVENQTMIRATHIMGGGHVKLGSVRTEHGDAMYVAFASNFYLLPPPADTLNKPPHYRVHVMSPDKQHSFIAFTGKRRINSSKLCDDGTLCMIVSSSPLTLEFKQGMNCSFFLATPLSCTTTTKMALNDYMLELWTTSSTQWPLRFEVNIDMTPRAAFDRSMDEYYARLFARYHVLFNGHPPFSTEELEFPAHGYTMFRVEEEVIGCMPRTGETISRKMVKHELFSLNQYSSFSDPGNRDCDANKEYKKLRVHFSSTTGEPSFEGSTIVEEEHKVGVDRFKLHALVREGEASPWCYFFINRERTYMLFIPLF